MKSTKIKNVCATAVFTAAIAALSPFPIPTPLGVPITPQTAVIAVTAFLLGAEYGTAAVVCYVLLGAAGLPVFSGFTGGAGVLLGPTGGFIFAFPLFALVLSLVLYVNKAAAKILLCLAALILLYGAGATQFTIVTGNAPAVALSAFIPYFIKDAVMVAAAYFLCVRIRPAIGRFIHS